MTVDPARDWSRALNRACEVAPGLPGVAFLSTGDSVWCYL
jgi:hypothetical protein